MRVIELDGHLLWGGGGRQRISLGSKPRLWLLSFAPSESPPRAWHGCRAELVMEALMGQLWGNRKREAQVLLLLIEDPEQVTLTHTPRGQPPLPRL